MSKTVTIPIPGEAREILVPLPAFHEGLRAVLDTVLEGKLGVALADDGKAPRVTRLDLGCYAIMGGDCRVLPHGLRTYPSPEALATSGIGRGIVKGGELVSAATSYARSSRQVEVALSTRPDHRGKGLGEAVAAGMLLDCLERGLEPCWSAANPVSQRLARRLGYRDGSVIEVLWLQ